MGNIRIRKADGKWSVRAVGAILVESSNALELSEGDYPPVIYFPRSDVAMAFLDKTNKSTHCPHKGEASYYTVVAKSRSLENAAWSYEAPLEGVAAIAGHLAFVPGEDVKVEQI